MRLRFVSVPAAVALLCAAGCSLITRYDDYTGGGVGTDATVKDSGVTDAGVEAAPTTEQTLCGPDIPPPPGVDKAESDLTVYTGVVSALRFTPADAGCPVIGKNLDRIDSCQEGGACITSYTATGCLADLTGGVDNQAQTAAEGFLLNELTSSALFTNAPTDIADQRTGFVLTVSSYRGELNNPLVNVGFQSDVGTADGGTLVDESSIIANRVDLQTQGYVTNGVLVATFSRPIPLHFTTVLDAGIFQGLQSAVLQVSNATIIGHPIVADGGLTMTDAQLVGRLAVADLAAGLTSFFACIDSTVAPQFCNYLDLPIDPADDGKNVACEALSFAIGFDLAPTVVTGTGTAAPPLDRCSPSVLPVDNMVCAESMLDGGPDADATVTTVGDGGGDDDSGP
jgi:hypothetical protein